MNDMCVATTLTHEENRLMCTAEMAGPGSLVQFNIATDSLSVRAQACESLDFLDALRSRRRVSGPSCA